MPNANLYDYALLNPFTPGYDIATSNSGWELSAGQSVNAQAGNDAIIGIGSGYGIINDGGNIIAGKGDDTIEGSGVIAINNSGTIDAGNGNDSIYGSGGPYSISGIYNDGTINGGNGDDFISGTVDAFFIGNDGIVNYGIIDAGNGNDTIVGARGILGRSAIRNYGTIAGGNGDDIIDALRGGFEGSGTIDLGNNNDTLKGFARDQNGTFKGANGIDKILLGDGVYIVAPSGSNWGITYTTTGITMTIAEFEQIGGATSGLFALTAGQFQVVAGDGAFV